MKCFIQGRYGTAVGEGRQNPCRVERLLMTIQSLLTSPPAAGEDETKWSFLRRLILALASERQKKADEIVREYRQRKAEKAG